MCRSLFLAFIALTFVGRAFCADVSILSRTNLVAWCIVPFDAKKRGPEERAEMLNRLGIQRLAYDWRDEHIPTFDEEVLAMQRHGIEMTAWWVMGGLNDTTRKILDVLRRHDLHSQLWVLLGEPLPGSSDQVAKVNAAAAELKPLAEEAAKIGCKVALYNHGGWYGEPENQIAIIKEINLPNVGMVYNFHHGHEHIARFPEFFAMMKPYLLALNINGMVPDGDKEGHMIFNVGQGTQELPMLRTVLESGWRGPVGILDHRPETDSEETLGNNLRGLDWLVKELMQPGSGGTRPFPLPKPVIAKPSAAAAPAIGGLEALPKAFGSSLSGGKVAEGSAAYREPPITVECWAKLRSRNGFNILVASDEKRSATHWELYTYVGTGEFSVFLPGRGGEVRSGINICDGKWHHVAMVLAEKRIQLFVNGRKVKEAELPEISGEVIPGGIAFGRLVEGGIGCDGWVDNVRISKGAIVLGRKSEPAKKDEATVGLWDFDGEKTDASTARDKVFWTPENAEERAQLPEFKIIPTALKSELTRADPSEAASAGAGRDWIRSHGDNGGTRFSRLAGITVANVHELQPAWIYHSKDGTGNIQCNPVIVDGVIYAPTVGEHVVAINGATGSELWRFKPEGRPAHRGLVYWPGGDGAPACLLFTSGDWLYALNPKTGKALERFGDGGKIRCGASVVAPGIYKDIVVVPGFDKDVSGFDLRTGKRLWIFHTIPHAGEFGYDTWDNTESGANCWGGMALDQERGIAYVSTGSPKPNFIGVHHRGDNLFANCLIALDVKTGKRLWHFQEIRHDIWDLDIAAPPNLVTVEHDGMNVSAVAQVTKLGNTLLLDRLTGKPLFPFRLRRAPVSRLPGERTAAYQPDPELPEPFAKQIFSRDDITDRTEEAHEFVLNQVRNANYGWFEPLQEGRPTVFRGIHGGAEWTGAAVDPGKGRLYVSANELPWSITVFRTDDVPRDPNQPPTHGEKIFMAACSACHGANREGVGVAPPLQGLRHRLDDRQVKQLLATGRNGMPPAPPMSDEDRQALLDFLFLRDRPQAAAAEDAPPVFTSNGYPKLLDNEGYPGTKPPWGTLNCIDLNSGRLMWKVPLGEYDELSAAGMPKTGTENFGGPIATAGGLVFCGGTRDEKIRAFDAATGAELWSYKLPWGGYAPPASYEAGGRQYIVISATGGGKLGGPMGDAYMAFALPRAESAPGTNRAQASVHILNAE